MIVQNFHIKMGKALFQAAQSQKMEEKVAADMEALSELMNNEHFASMMREIGQYPPMASKKLLTETFQGKIQDMTLKFLIAVAHQRALKFLGKIAAVYRKNYFEAKGITEIVFRTARAFSPQEQNSFIEKIQGKNKKQITVKFEIDPNLIGGAQIYEKSYLTDYSLKNYLETLKKHLLSQQMN